MIGQFILEVTFSIRLGPLRWVPIAHCAGRRGLNLLTVVKPVELDHLQMSYFILYFTLFICDRYIKPPFSFNNSGEIVYKILLIGVHHQDGQGLNSGPQCF